MNNPDLLKQFTVVLDFDDEGGIEAIWSQCNDCLTRHEFNAGEGTMDTIHDVAQSHLRHAAENHFAEPFVRCAWDIPVFNARVIARCDLEYDHAGPHKLTIHEEED